MAAVQGGEESGTVEIMRLFRLSRGACCSQYAVQNTVFASRTPTKVAASNAAMG
jgi:hypothetical protein